MRFVVETSTKLANPVQGLTDGAVYYVKKGDALLTESTYELQLTKGFVSSTLLVNLDDDDKTTLELPGISWSTRGLAVGDSITLTRTRRPGTYTIASLSGSTITLTVGGLGVGSCSTSSVRTAPLGDLVHRPAGRGPEAGLVVLPDPAGRRGHRPAGRRPNLYYVVDSTPNTFRLSLTPNGNAMDLVTTNRGSTVATRIGSRASTSA